MAMAMVWVVPASAQWTSHEVTDHLRGKTGLAIETKGDIDGEYGRRPAQLTVYCEQNQTYINIASKPFYVGGDTVTVEYTLDGGPVQRATWSVCQGDGCVGLWRGSGIPFLKSLYGKSMLRMTIHPRHLKSSNVTFAIAGAKEMLAPLAKLCGWS